MTVFGNNTLWWLLIIVLILYGSGAIRLGLKLTKKRLLCQVQSRLFRCCELLFPCGNLIVAHSSRDCLWNFSLIGSLYSLRSSEMVIHTYLLRLRVQKKCKNQPAGTNSSAIIIRSNRFEWQSIWNSCTTYSTVYICGSVWLQKFCIEAMGLGPKPTE